MSTGFQRTRTGRTVLRVDEMEKAVLTSLAEQMIAFVAPNEATESTDPLALIVGIDEVAETPSDPALARMFPAAYRDDDEAAGDFRRFTERDLRATKIANSSNVAVCLKRHGEKIVLTADEALCWLGFLNDTRIAIGTRLEITEENHDDLAKLPEDDPRAGLFDVYDWLTFLQDSLVRLHMDAD
ncbi:MAG: DUF2017 domain-containing protein [Actinomycetota bacterium]|nr:DUF2017 domain-containing protein [Actinomycetota bacterium]